MRQNGIGQDHYFDHWILKGSRMLSGYIILGVAILGLLAFDLMSHKEDSVITIKSAGMWSMFYIAAAMGFAIYVNYAYSTQWAQYFLTGYALEKVLAVDNLFAFMMIFAYFGIKPEHQHKILYWGILGAIVFRAIFVALGTGFTAMFGPWAEIVFAIIIGWTAIKMLSNDEDGDGDQDVDYSNTWYIRVLKKVLPVTDKTDGSSLFIRTLENGKLQTFATPLFVCLVAIEISDIIFAFDSVPAVIAVSKEPYIVFSAMIFAILGLRSLYFVLEAMRAMLSRLETAVVVILGFIALKLGLSAGSELAVEWGLINNAIHIDPFVSLAIVITLLTGGIMWSILENRNKPVSL